MKHRNKGLEANTSIFFVPQSNSVICWKSAQFPDSWSWHSSLDRVGRQCEFQQISELWIRIVYLHAKCLKRLSVIRKSKEWLRRHQRADMWQSVNRRVYQRISNNDVDVRGETAHSMQQQSEFQRRNIWSLLTHPYTWNIKLFHISCSQNCFILNIRLINITLPRRLDLTESLSDVQCSAVTVDCQKQPNTLFS